MSTTQTEPTTRTLEVPGAVLTYDVRRNESSTDPVLFIIGSPMGAGGFVTLAGHFTDRTIVTYDPRGVDRSTKADPTTESTPEQHADDVHRIIQALGSGAVDLFASSGGAVNALALVARHPDDVRTLVAHEPPAASALPDHEEAMAVNRAVHETYLRRGFGAGMAHFIAIVGHRGPFTAEDVAQPGPDPAMFGMPTEDDGSRDDPLLSDRSWAVSSYRPDVEALAAAPTRVVIAVGEESEGTFTARTSLATAELLGQQVTVFPSHHGGFLGGEFGYAGQPEAFARKLRDVLDDGG